MRHCRDPRMYTPSALRIHRSSPPRWHPRRTPDAVAAGLVFIVLFGLARTAHGGYSGWVGERARRDPRRRAPRPAPATRWGTRGGRSRAHGAAPPQPRGARSRPPAAGHARRPDGRAGQRPSPQGPGRRPPRQAGAHRYLLRARIFLRLRLRRRMRFFRHLARIFCGPSTGNHRARASEHVSIAARSTGPGVGARGRERDARGIEHRDAHGWPPSAHPIHPARQLHRAPMRARTDGRHRLHRPSPITSLAPSSSRPPLNPAPSAAPTARAARALPARPPRCTPCSRERAREGGERRWGSRGGSGDTYRSGPSNRRSTCEGCLRVSATSRTAPRDVTEAASTRHVAAADNVADDMTIALPTFRVHHGHFGATLGVD